MAVLTFSSSQGRINYRDSLPPVPDLDADRRAANRARNELQRALALKKEEKKKRNVAREKRRAEQRKRGESPDTSTTEEDDNPEDEFYVNSSDDDMAARLDRAMGLQTRSGLHYEPEPEPETSGTAGTRTPEGPSGRVLRTIGVGHVGTSAS